DLFIITNFNKMMVAFHVDSIEGISRISWKNISKPDKTLENGEDSVATGIAQCDDELVTILDFEKIVAEIAPETSIKISEVEEMGPREDSTSPIVIAEDSVLLQQMVRASLEKAGYKEITIFNNGKECWDYLTGIRNDADLYDKVNVIITDLEMPMMDGHRLTKLVKTDEKLKNIPVVIFSSLINEQMFLKGKEVGADEQLSKPEIGHLVQVLDELIRRFREQRAKGFQNS
ncbi:MAG: response regulator, partial [Eubacterium sp.]|nr:response regulator [Eubacterium sp.]